VATKADIKKAILEVAGNPDSGVIFEYAERFADAIVDLDSTAVETASERSIKETRVTKPEETR
jgi:UTP:GlnB (protein PII) uridylyltransferase